VLLHITSPNRGPLTWTVVPCHKNRKRKLSQTLWEVFSKFFPLSFMRMRILMGMHSRYQLRNDTLVTITSHILRENSFSSSFLTSLHVQCFQALESCGFVPICEGWDGAELHQNNGWNRIVQSVCTCRSESDDLLIMDAVRLYQHLLDLRTSVCVLGWLRANCPALTDWQIVWLGDSRHCLVSSNFSHSPHERCQWIWLNSLLRGYLRSVAVQWLALGKVQPRNHFADRCVLQGEQYVNKSGASKR